MKRNEDLGFMGSELGGVLEWESLNCFFGERVGSDRMGSRPLVVHVFLQRFGGDPEKIINRDR